VLDERQALEEARQRAQQQAEQEQLALIRR
jgi:hypothetical protein